MMKRLLVIFGLIGSIAVAAWMLTAAPSASAGTLPQVSYLGETGTHTIPADRFFIVKRLDPFRFDLESGPEYTIGPWERLWSTDNGAPPAVYHAWVELGYAPAGCVVRYTAIDDDVDDRINIFYLDGEPVHEMAQGMVTSGQFYLDSGGDLRVYAADSIGMWAQVCEEVIPPTPTETPTSTATNTPTATLPPTNTPTPSITPTLTPTPTGTAVTPTATPTASATHTPTATPPTATVLPPQPTTTPTATPTKEPRLNACLRINFEVSGDEAKRGLYVVQEVGGAVLHEWYALDGWQDSGWVDGIDIPYPAVYVNVNYYSGPGANPVTMKIYNPAPDSSSGWLSRGMCHAIEVGWP